MNLPYFSTMIDNIKKWLRIGGSWYVTMDTEKNFTTFSRSLCKHLISRYGTVKNIVTFSFNHGKNYGFTLESNLEDKTQLGLIHYNPKLRSFGYESIIPTVSKIFNDYNISGKVTTCRFKVNIRKAHNGMVIYELERPEEDEKHIGNHTKA